MMALQKKENTTIPLLRQQLAETEKAIANMLNAIQQGVLTSSTKARLEELEETKSKLEVAIIQEEMQKPTLTREFVTFFIHRFRNTDITDREQRQRLIDSFINAIYLYDDKIVLTFNYKDESKTITLKDIEQAFGSDLEALGVPDAQPPPAHGVCGGRVCFMAAGPRCARSAQPSPSASASSCLMLSSRWLGVCSGSKRKRTLPWRSTKNLVKFHLMSGLSL